MDIADASVDLALFHLINHDMFWLYPDQIDDISKELLLVVKPGGRVVIIDHDTAEGEGNSQALSRSDGTHRLKDAYVEDLMSTTGFKLIETSDALRNAGDDHSKLFLAPEMRGKPTDRFFHIYQR